MIIIMINTSSRAISSNGFMECFTPSVTTPSLSGFTLILKYMCMPHRLYPALLLLRNR